MNDLSILTVAALAGIAFAILKVVQQQLHRKVAARAPAMAQTRLRRRRHNEAR